ncbi:MAG TPA: PilZ domain-containing protein [Pyrinomonadaceae bacterium]|nr:PilZ domain-containing protein [Pyrinomonadaceae bacterium]
MSEQRNWKRIRERLALHLPVRVRLRETPDFEWTEVTRLTNVTPFGAGFTLKRPTERGRLLHMTIPMPRQFRVYDHVEDQYRIWAIVRHVKATLSSTRQTVFEVGVAFIGKRAPLSYEKEPWKRYDIATNIFEALTPADNMLTPLPSVDQRAFTRFNIAVDMRVEILDVEGEIVESEQTVTEDISSHGATLFTTLQAPPGRFIRLTSEQQGITAHAAIRSRSTGADGIPRIHVEFIDKEWPL